MTRRVRDTIHLITIAGKTRDEKENIGNGKDEPETKLFRENKNNHHPGTRIGIIWPGRPGLNKISNVYTKSIFIVPLRYHNLI